jgi:Fe-S cluster assembly ATP-binding protein
MSRLVITDLHATVAGKEILHGISLEVGPGEIHAVMGPNGSGKSTLAHAIMGRPGTTVTSGSIQLDGRELVGRPTHERARAGLFLALQQPLEVPGVGLAEALSAARPGTDDASVTRALDAAAQAIGLRPDLLDRALNVGLSGGERKRSEIVQLDVLQRPFALLDEIDSGLDVDALAAIGTHLSAASKDPERQLSVIAITHFRRLLDVLTPDRIHVLVNGELVDSGGPELVTTLEAEGYARYKVASPSTASAEDPFGF